MPFYVNELFVPSTNIFKTRSYISLEIPLRKGNLGQKSISFMEPSIWNKLSNEMKILTTSTLVTHNLKKLQKNIIKSSRQDEDFVKTSKKHLKNRSQAFPIVRYFTGKLELVSNIL